MAEQDVEKNKDIQPEFNSEEDENLSDEQEIIVPDVVTEQAPEIGEVW